MAHSVFIDKFIERLGKIDSKRVERYLASLAEELTLFEGVFESMPEGIIVVGKSEKILMINNNACRLLGISKMGEGRHIKEIIIDEPILDMVKDALKGAVNVYGMEMAEPAGRIMALNISPLLDERKRTTGIVLIITDITEKKYYQQSLARNEKIDSLRILAGGVAHELGNPLNSIGIHLQLIERDIRSVAAKKKDKMIEHISILKEEISRLDGIIKTFLSAVRPFRGEFQEEDVNSIIDEVIKLIAPQLKSRGILLSTKYDIKLPAVLVAKGEIMQAVRNILKNAMEAIGRGGQILVATSIRNERIVIKIKDSGPGIPAEEISKVFEPYYSNKDLGSGLGLMIVQRIMNQHGGYVEVESGAGAGATFKLIIPVRKKKRRFLITEGLESER